MELADKVYTETDKKIFYLFYKTNYWESVQYEEIYNQNHLKYQITRQKLACSQLAQSL